MCPLSGFKCTEVLPWPSSLFTLVYSKPKSQMQRRCLGGPSFQQGRNGSKGWEGNKKGKVSCHGGRMEGARARAMNKMEEDRGEQEGEKRKGSPGEPGRGRRMGNWSGGGAVGEPQGTEIITGGWKVGRD